jgi:hypothetical protein
MTRWGKVGGEAGGGKFGYFGLAREGWVESI